jgi:hypothetical protein
VKGVVPRASPRLKMKILSIVPAVLGMALTPLAEAGVKNMVIVHGAFADGFGWRRLRESRGICQGLRPAPQAGRGAHRKGGGGGEMSGSTNVCGPTGIFQSERVHLAIIVLY